ncbi:MAG: hypothetical protein C0193_00110 [Candidatus Bathyarchaeota archaeon]|nr:MAG: hypothetical protein C0193_00110 [Candidatus Bathyarchaeota archaeon]
MITPELIGAWLAAIIVVWIYSFVYKDNLLYRVAEHLFVGTAAGYSIALSLDSLNKTAFVPLGKDIVANWHLIIPLLLGLTFFLKYSKKYYWVARYGVGVNVAVGAALALRTAPMANIIKQINAAIVPLWVADDLLKTFNNWLMVLITLGGLTYFIFTIFPKAEGKSTPVHKIYRAFFLIGVYGMMVGFGALFANTIMTRVGFLIGIYLQYFQPQPYAALIALILAVIAIAYAMRRK